MTCSRIIALLLSLAFAATGCRDKNPSFVSVSGREFVRNGRPYYYMGANYWQGMNLGSSGQGGDRLRLRRELDQMRDMGISNLRILALSEGPDGSMLRILPAVQDRPGILKEELLIGLDLLLDEMSRRDMTAVLVLNNFWPWSGGMAQYRLWNGADSIPYPPPHGKGTWDSYQKYTAGFYSDTISIRRHHDAIRAITARRNTVNGKVYAQDPTIMSWQLCNEPRGIDNTERMLAWIDTTAALIKQLAPNQLVSTGAEGYTSAPEYTGTDFIRMHDRKNIDYGTAHVWIQNWGWYDPRKHDSTYPAARQHMLDYVRRHAEDAAKIGKPWVMEEFGIMKDDGSFSPAATNTHRDAYYAEVFGAILAEARKGSASGVNFWAYGGEGRPRTPGEMWAKGDPFTGDPPHEPQGWYSVYDTDTSTKGVIRHFARQFKALCDKPKPGR